METISFFCRRFGIRVIAVALIIYAAQAGPIRAQANGSGTNTPPARSSKTTTPANPDDDHFDPDDLQTFGDVVTEDRAVTVRGRVFIVHFYRPKATGPAIPAIYACGDGGWRGLAPRTALQMAHSGFAVAGVDSKIYLRRFSSPTEPLLIVRPRRD